MRGVGVVTLILLGVVLASPSSAGDARVTWKQTRVAFRHVPHVTECRLGWWQGLTAGHVRPRWQMRCV
jgi:hypothetical protein